MPEDEKIPGGNNGGTGGSPDDKPKKDVVSYETHTKLLDEKKSLKARNEELANKLAEFERSKEETERKKLEEQGEYKKLLEAERKQKEELASRLTGIETTMIEHAKRSAVLKNIKGSVMEKYQSFIDVSKVAYDPETGEVDATTAKMVADEFQKEHKVLISSSTIPGMPPQDAPKGGDTKMTPAQWRALKSSKEMKEKFKDVDWSVEQ